ncbi:hypothetical protein CC80DRAFT_547879 [Byssothecium circinans]|uniref:Uncharacterized protein n=1 Tax=Byssothecium circinans TaxID=147558 RepID=A0A6A5TX11_9PLEO|nr:hypothetical protein CC80DRAFT_547879 [Byssothecium circinans]
MLEERARLRLVAKEIRLQQQQAKAREREETRITNAKTPLLPTAPPTAPKAVEVVEMPTEDVGSSVPRETRTRKVQLPQRYRM